MTLLWFLTGAALLAAFVTWRQARATARRVEQLSQMYWELKYQHGELRVKLQRLSGEEPPAAAQTPVPRPTDGFVPISSLKR